MISIIVCMAQNHVIGKDNKMPWHLSEDLKHFKKITMGHPIIMGRKTFESIGKPLPGRENIILTRALRLKFSPEGVTVIPDLINFLHESRDILRMPPKEIFIIGGAEIYKQALPLCDKIYLTHIKKDFSGDTYFPEIDFEKDFEIIEQSEVFISEKEKLPYEFIVAKRRLS